MTNFSALPTEILIQIFNPLSPYELSVMAQCCRRMYDLIYEFGWLQYHLSNRRPSYSLTNSRRQWTTHERVRYDTLTDRAWQKVEFIARPLSRTWAAKEQATLAVSPSRLIIAAGTLLHCYSFHNASGNLPSVQWEGDINLNQTHVRGRNITAITFIDDGGLDETLLVAYQEHLVERIKLIPPVSKSEDSLSFARMPLSGFPSGDYVESFSPCSGHILSLSSNGTAQLSSQSILVSEDNNAGANTFPSPPISTIDLAERSWKSYLTLASSTPFAALGSTGKIPLTIHNILPDSGLAPLPSVILHTEKTTDPDNLSSSAVYGITSAPPSSPWGSSPQIIASGWFDGRARIYDLRCASQSQSPSQPSSLSPSPSSASTSSGTQPKYTAAGTPLLTPVLVMADRWSTEPIYSLSSGGGSGAHLAAGTARHSVVSFWDVRAPGSGWSVHAPGNDRSPVFNVHLESSRLFGVTELRGFMYDFGPDITANCFPSIASSPRSQNREGLKHKPGILSYRVTKYRHKSSGLGDDFN